MVTFSGKFTATASVYDAIKVVSNHADISSATTTNLDVVLGKNCDILGVDLSWTARVAADYISSIRVLDTSNNVKHIIFSGIRHTPYTTVWGLYPLQPIYKGALSTDKIRITFVSTTTAAQTLTGEIQIAQDVQVE